MNIFKWYRKQLLKFFINNPSLGEELDYKSQSTRYRVYSSQLKSLSDDEILSQIISWYEEGELN